MKALLRIPTKESYAYIEVECEGTDDEIVSQYRKMTVAVTGGFGLEEKEWNRILDNYLWGTGDMRPDEYEGMSPAQQEVIQLIKRSRKRSNYESKKK